MLEVQTREQELQHNNQLKEQGIPRKWELLCANLRKEKKSQLLNLLQWSDGITFGYESVASDSEYNPSGVKKLYLDKRFRGVIASFKKLRDVQYVTDETVKKLISVICAMRSVMGKYTTKIIPIHLPTISKKKHSTSKDPRQLELQFEEDDQGVGAKEYESKEQDWDERQKELNEMYDDRDTDYEYRWQEYNNR